MSEEGEISRSTCVDTLVIAIDVAFSIFDPQLNIFLTATSDVPQVAEMRPNIYHLPSIYQNSFLLTKLRYTHS